MTQSPNSLEDLRLLREAPLPSGFEERLRVRLAAAAAEQRVTPMGSRRRYHGLLLLAAIALPVAAFAAGGVMIAQRFSESPKPAATAVETKSVPVTAKRPGSLPPRSPAIAPSVAPAPRSEDEPKKATEGRGSALKADGKAQVGSAPRGGLPAKSEVTEVVPTKVEAVPPTVESGPAKIESLDLTLPARRGSTTHEPSSSGAAKSSELRGATVKGNINRVGAEGAASGQNREQAGERRGNDAAAQAKERVQARERKGP